MPARILILISLCAVFLLGIAIGNMPNADNTIHKQISRSLPDGCRLAPIGDVHIKDGHTITAVAVFCDDCRSSRLDHEANQQ